MMDMQQLLEWDKQCLLAVNGSDSLFLDGVMWVVSDTKTWLLLGAVLLFVIFKNNTWKNALLMVVMIALAVALADQFASGLCKPYFMRFRPSQDPDLMSLVKIVNGYRGGRYGFISSHSANCFAVATMVSLLMRDRRITLLMFLWALLPSFSRAYLGVHYPGDLLCGAVAGCAISWLVYYICGLLRKRFFAGTPNVSSAYISSCCMAEDAAWLFVAMLLTAFYVVVRAMIQVYVAFF